MTQPDPRDDLISVTEIAELADVARSTVSNWKRRYSDFPTPRGEGSHGPLFRRDEIRAWLQERGRLRSTEPADASNPVSLVAATTSAMSTTYTVPHAVRLMVKALDDRPPIVPLPENTSRILSDLKLNAPDPADVATAALEFLAANDRSEMHATPGPLADFMCAVLGDRSNAYDPAAGLGRLLGGCVEHNHVRHVFGQEIDEEAADVARSYLRILDGDADIRVGDTLVDDAFAGRQFDGIICNPPLGTTSGEPLNPADQRWVYGMPRRSEDAWIQHILHHLAPGGRAVVLTASRFLSSGGQTADLRSSLLRSGSLRAAIQLPSGVLTSTAIETAVLVLERNDPTTAAPAVLVGEPDLGVDRRSGDWDTAKLQSVVDLISLWLDGAGPALPAEFRELDLDALAAADFVLDPRRILSAASVEVRNLTDVRRDVRRRSKSLSEAATRLAEHVAGAESQLPTKTDGVEFMQLARIPGLRIERGTSRLNRTVTDAPDTGEDSRFIHSPQSIFGESATASSGPRREGGRSDAKRSPVPANPGELLVVLDGPLLGRVHTVTEPMLISPHFAVIDASESDVDADFLALWLRSPAVQAELQRLATGTTLVRVALQDFGRVRVPLPPAETQQSMAALGRSVDAAARDAASLQEGLRALVDLAGEAVLSAIGIERGNSDDKS